MALSKGQYLGGVPRNTSKSSTGGLAPSGRAALIPSGRATNRIAKSVGSIPAATPKAGTRPSTHPVQRP